LIITPRRKDERRKRRGTACVAAALDAQAQLAQQECAAEAGRVARPFEADTCTLRRCGVARVVYSMLKYKVEYETINIEEYEAKYKEQQIKYMKKKAAKLVSNSSRRNLTHR